MQIHHARTDEEILATFDVMSQLHPPLKRADYLQRVRLQVEATGYQLSFLTAEPENPEKPVTKILAVAGYHFVTVLAWGKTLYVDDLVTDEGLRSTGCGQKLLQHLIKIARHENCDQFHLDCGVKRYSAHRFYLKQGMNITAHHFALKL